MKLTYKNIFLKRPGGGDYGILDLNNLYGKTVIKRIKQNTQIKKKDIFSSIFNHNNRVQDWQVIQNIFF